MEKRIVIFASGSGTNAENIIKYFQNTKTATVAMVLSNKQDAKVLDRAANLNVPAKSFTRKELMDPNGVLAILEDINPDLIVLAGFLLKCPEAIIERFPNKIINIHPALLPNYGGKGMYGMFVHESVITNKEVESGISIHFVNEEYDEGAIILQKTVTIEEGDTPESLAQKIHQLEYKWFPIAIEELLLQSDSEEKDIQEQ